MFALPLGRIVWKEYRANRTLWLACAAIGWALKVLSWSLVVGTHERFSMMSGIPGVLGFCYAAACSALMFAGEREERTSGWLLNLSVPPAAIVVGKLSFAVLSIMALQLVLALPSLMVMSTMTAMPGLFWQLFTPIGLVALLWTIPGSLTSRRVLVSVAPMVCWWIFTLLVPVGLLQSLWSPHFDDVRSGLWRMSILGMVMFATAVVDLWLSWRWARGHYLDGSIIDGWHQWCRSWLARRTLTRWSGRSIVGRVEHEQPWRRTWQRLIWQERQRESIHNLLFVGGCALAFWMANQTQTDLAISNLLIVYVLLVSMAMGLFAFESIREQPQVLFLIGRGVSPAAVWLAKQAVWLPRAFWITGILFVLGSMAEHRPQSRLAFRWIELHPYLAVCLVLMSYGCGQLAATLLRSTILAGVLGVLLTFVVAGWLIGTDWLGLPLGLLWGLPLVALPLVSLWQMRPRMLDDQSWLRHAKLVSVTLLLPVVLFTALGVYRFREVLIAKPLEPASLARLKQTRPSADADRAAYWEVKLRAHAIPPTFGVDDEVARKELIGLFESPHNAPELADQVADLLSRDVKTLQFPLQGTTNRLSFGGPLGSPASLLNELSSSLQIRARDHMREGERARSFKCLLGNLKLARLLARQQTLNGDWSECSRAQFAVVESLVEWADYPFQTPAVLREAIRDIQHELDQFPPATDAIVASYVSDRKAIDSNSFEDISDALQDNTRLLIHSPYEFVAAMYLPWERARLRILMGREAQFLFENAMILQDESPDPSEEAVYGSIVRDLKQRDRLSDVFLEAYEARRQIREIVLQRQTTIRAALIRMELIAYRLEHEKLPGTLIELLATNPNLNIVDPWSNRIFEYYPTFLLTAGDTGITLRPVSANRLEIRDERTLIASFAPDQVLTPSVFRELTSLNGVGRFLFPIPLAPGRLIEP